MSEKYGKKRFANILHDLKRKPLLERQAGLTGFSGGACSLCYVKFDVGDAKIWTRESGKCHFRCYVQWKKQGGLK